MLKLILTATLLAFSAMTFSQEVPAPQALATEASPASEATVESAANSVGKWLGRLVQAPVAVTKSLIAGVKTGYVDAASATPVAPASVSPEVPASKESSAGTTMSFEAAMKMVGNQFSLRQAPAPVEDRSSQANAQ